jgi:two-component system, chemotaxis family, response regulator Rcp1
MKPVEVLMIEDNRGDVVLVEAAIEKAGLPYHVTVVSDGAEAIEFLHRRGKYAESPQPGLIMLDLKLPRKNGCEVLDEIRPNPLLGKTPLVLLSSSKSELKRARSFGLPEECYLEKASTFQGFVELVQAIEAFRCKTLKENQP